MSIVNPTNPVNEKPPSPENPPEVRLGQHVPDEHFDRIMAGDPGSIDNPFVTAPENETDGLPYGAWCRCGTCGNLGRSTVVFDFYANGGTGQPLTCEDCAQIEWAKLARAAAVRADADDLEPFDPR